MTPSPITNLFSKYSTKWKKYWDKRAEKKRKEFAQLAADWAHEHKDSFIMLADPVTDVMVMAYQDVLVPVRLTDKKTGTRLKIVENALAYQKGEHGERAVDQFLLVVDSGIVQIADAIYNRRSAETSEKVIGELGGKVVKTEAAPASQ